MAVDAIDANRSRLLCWPVALWPEEDQRLWLANTAPGDRFDDPRVADDLRPDSIEKYRKGYGRFLCFLWTHGLLSANVPPAERLTKTRLIMYLRHLRNAGNRDYTIIGRFAELRMALKILAPDVNTGWVVRPTGHSIFSMFQKQTRNLFVPDSFVLRDWARGLLDDARRNIETPEKLIQYRDGLVLLLLAVGGRRLKSMASLRVGHELVRCGTHYEVRLSPKLVKTRRSDRFPVPEDLTPYIEYYLDDVRPALLRGARHDGVWISQHGTPLTPAGFETMVWKRSRRQFGTGFGPHRFRHAIVTSAALYAPAVPGLGAGVLNITRAVSDKHYNRAESENAVNALEAINAKRRKEFGIEI